MRKTKGLIYILLLCIMLCSSVIISSAAAEQTRELMSDPCERVIAISHGGDTTLFPANSLEAIRQAESVGADAVSVPVNKTADGEFVLCEDVTLSNVCRTTASSLDEITFEELKKCALYNKTGSPTEVYPASLKQVLEELGGEVYLILDIKYEDIDEICELLRDCNSFSNVSLRCEVKSSEADKLSNCGADVISIYDGNIVWESINHTERFSEAGMNMVEYRTKNYFNVCYGTIVGDNFSADGKARAVAAAFDPDLCGQRTDDTNGWNELVKNGFTVIETNNISGLCMYVEASCEQYGKLEKLVRDVKDMDISPYSEISRKNIEYALSDAETVLDGRAKSLAEYEGSYSALLHSLNTKMIADGKEETKGALNITAGKIAVVVLVGAAFIAVQIFIEKLKKEKATDKEEITNGNKTESVDNKS